jgi:drug/metabolite transporter (DMT)-like permease
VQKETFKGYFYTILATIAFSNVYVFSKAALNEISLPLFLFLMCSMGFAINLVVLAFKGGFSKLLAVPKAMWWIFPTLGLIEIFAVFMFYASVNAISEPAVTGFLGNLFPLFTTMLGILFLKERFSPIETVGVFVVFAGALLTSYSGNVTLKDFFIPGVGLVVMNCLGAATATVIVRAKVKNLTPEILSFNRTFWLLIFFSGWVFLSKTPIVFSNQALTNTFFAAILDPVLSILLVYRAYLYIEASRGTIIQSMKGLVIIPVAYFYFGTLPLPHQIAGGIIAMFGVVIIALGQHAMDHRKRLTDRVRATDN